MRAGTEASYRSLRSERSILAGPNPGSNAALQPLDGKAAKGVCSDRPMMSGTWWCLVEDGKARLHGIIID